MWIERCFLSSSTVLPHLVQITLVPHNRNMVYKEVVDVAT